MHKAVIEILDITDAKEYVFIRFARRLPLPKRIWPTLYHTMRSLDVMPCQILLAMESDQLGMHSVRILTSLQILVRMTFMTKHIQVTREVHLQDVQYFWWGQAAVIMHGWLCLASAEYLKHYRLPTSNVPPLHIQRALYQAMVCIQAKCNIPLLPPQPETMRWAKGNWTLVPTVMSLAPMCRSYHMRSHQMMHLREMWLQKRKHALHKIVQVQSLSCVWTMTVDDVVKRKCHSSSCFLYKTKMCV